VSILSERSTNTAPRQSLPTVIPALLMSFQLLVPAPLKAFPVEGAGCVIRDAAPLRPVTAPLQRQGSQQRSAIDLSSTISQLEATSQLSRSALAAMIGVSRPTFYSWASGNPVRRQNAERAVALLDAMRRLATFQQGAALPALWQHQSLPDSGMTFAEGVQRGIAPGHMANELITLWTRDRTEAAALDKLFATRG